MCVVYMIDAWCYPLFEAYWAYSVYKHITKISVN